MGNIHACFSGLVDVIVLAGRVFRWSQASIGVNFAGQACFAGLIEWARTRILERQINRPTIRHYGDGLLTRGFMNDLQYGGILSDLAVCPLGTA